MTPAVSFKTISCYKAGKLLPSSDVLMVLCVLLNKRSYFFGRQIVSLDSIQRRKHSAVPARDIARAKVQVIERIESYWTMDSVLQIALHSAPFQGMRVQFPSDYGFLEQNACDLRYKWSLGIDPVPSMVSLLERQGLKAPMPQLSASGSTSPRAGT